MGLTLVVLTAWLASQAGLPAAMSSRHVAGLFALPTARPPQARPTEPPAQTDELPSVICGMTIVRPESTGGDRMPRLTPPSDRRFTLRVEQPPIYSSGTPEPR